MYHFVEILSQKAFDKIDEKAMDLAEKTVINALVTCNVNRNNALVKGALWNALISLL